MTQIFVDTVFVVALINERDQYHAVARDLAAQFADAALVTTDAVLLEIGNALARGFKKEAAEVIESFLSSEVEVVHLTPLLFERAFALYRTYQDKTWSLVDCISFVVMRDAGIVQALTSDQHFAQAGLQALM